MKILLKQLVDGIRTGHWLTLDRLRGYALIFIVAYVLGIGIWIGLAEGMRDRAGHPLGTDFLNVYAAGLMTREGHAPEAYDWEKHGVVEKTVAGFEAPYYGWHYPPLFLGLAALLAFLPYFLAVSCYLVLGFVAYLLAIKRIAPPSRIALGVAAAFPGVFINIGNGQNGFITTALIAAGFSFLETQPWIAGFFFGLLAYKPQFFVLIPFVLCVSRSMRALIATVSTVAVTSALSVFFLGWETWQAFFASTRLTQGIILEQGATGWNKIQSVFSIVRMAGGSATIAYALHTLVACVAVFMLVKIWLTSSPLATRAAALVAAALLFTPYVLDYDLMVLAVPVAFLAQQGCDKGFRPYEKSLLAALWLLPFIARLMGTHGVIITPYLLFALLCLCFYRSRPASTSSA